MKVTDYGNRPISSKTIRRDLWYITRTIPGSPTRAILLHLGGFASNKSAAQVVFVDVEPGIKAYLDNMEGCATMSGAHILRLPSLFHVEKAMVPQ